MNCPGARQHERLNFIIEEAGLRGYFPFDALIQVMAVAGGAAALVMEPAEAGKHILQPLDQEITAVGLGADFQKRLFFFKFERQSRGHLKGKRPGRINAQSCPKLAIDERVALLKKAQERAFFLVLGGFAEGFGRFWEKFHQRFVIILFMQKIQRAKHSTALRQDVHATVVVIFQLLRDGGSAADGGDSLFTGEDYAELAILGQTIVNHQLVTRFENVQRERRARIEDDVEREQRYAGVCHFPRARDLANLQPELELTQQRQSRLHFVARVHVAGILRDQNAVG
jgi:hypothetical protein